MNEAQKAGFSFADYTISEFTFKDPKDQGEKELDLSFNPSGVYNIKDGLFVVHFDFYASYQNETEERIIVSTAKVDSTFRFDAGNDKIPEYFYQNSIAIVFPYIRAFLTTLTSLANTRQMILPLANLTSLKDVLKKNTLTYKDIDDLTEEPTSPDMGNPTTAA